MKRKIATLEVWLDDDADATSGLHGSVGSDQYRLLLATKQEAPENFPSIVAHELGHFMAYLLGDESHKRKLELNTMVNFRKFIGDWNWNLERKWTREVELPTEVQAWKYADMIYPEVKQDVRAAALYSYEGYGGATNDGL